MTLSPGTHVARYEIQAEVGEGSFGKVYRAWDPEFERWVAIKELVRAGVTDEVYQEHLERFRLERRIQGQFQHPNIVSVYDMVSQDGNEYLVEEFVAGGTLRDMIQKAGILSPAQVIQIGIALCQAVAAAWEQDVVHRDIKPNNILLTEEVNSMSSDTLLNIKLTDFGVAQIGQISQRTQSDTHHPGTPVYKSPEQEQQHGYLDERSDLYAVGLVLYEAVTGKLYKRERVPVRELNPAVPNPLARVIMRALASKPADRYQQAVDFEIALNRAARSIQAQRYIWLLWSIGGLIVLGGLIWAGWYWSNLNPTTLPPTQTLSATRSLFPPLHTVSPSPSLTVAATSRPPTLTAEPGATILSTSTHTPRATATMIIAAPALRSPAGATSFNSSIITFQWQGTLPNEDYGFRVRLEHNEGIYYSSFLEGRAWTTELPGDERWGEWRWSVVTVHKAQLDEELSQSNVWTFYYNPFGTSNPHPLTSPLSQQVSPLTTP
ncbi:MAG: serine/threonine protein kinase [Anaerolineae bacterium]|nr:serine/threonine protein kinase [Anaerolineae bacterium]